MNIKKQQVNAAKEDAGCYARAKKRGQQTFTLVAQDVTAPAVICEWIKNNIDTAPPAKLIDALMDAIAMRDYAPRKCAD